MDWKTFIAEIVKALSWPLALVLVMAMFRENLRSLFLGLKSFKHGDWEVTFRDELAAAKEHAAAAGGDPNQVPTDPRLLGLAEKFPRLAIVEAWQRIESLMNKLSLSHGGPLASAGFRWIEWAQGKEFISSEQNLLFQRLRELRNAALHATNR